MMKIVSIVFLSLFLGGCGGRTMYVQSDIPGVAESVRSIAGKVSGMDSFCKEAQDEARSVEILGYNGAVRTTIIHTCVK